MKVSSVFLKSLTTIGIVFLFSCSSPKQNRISDLNAYFEKETANGFSGNILLIENDSILFNRGFGWADKENQIANGANTIVPYGSIVKDYTKAAIIMLATDSLISLDDPMQKYFPGIPPDKKDITIKQLLQHRSGLRPYHDQDDAARKKWPNIPGDFIPMSKKECLEYIYKQELMFKPGTEFSYSNTGYTLLALVIESVTGKTYETVIREKILEPAGMATTDFYQSSKWKPEAVAIGYGPVKYGQRNSPYYWPRNPYPLLGNGGMAGTQYDFYLGLKFMENLEVGNKQYKEISSSADDMDGRLPEGIISSSGGNDFGFVSVIFGIIPKKQYMIFTSNNDQDGMEDIEMINQILKLGFDFDLMKLAPEGSGNDDESDTDAIPAASLSKWKIPNNKAHWIRTSLLLDLLDSQKTDSIWTFMNNNCSQDFIKSKSKQEHIKYFTQLMNATAPVSLKGAEYGTPVVKLRLEKAQAFKYLEITLTKNKKRLIDGMKLSDN